MKNLAYKFTRQPALMLLIILTLFLVACGDNTVTATAIPATITPVPAIPSPAATGASSAEGTTACGKIPYFTTLPPDPAGSTAAPVYTAIGASDTVGTGSTDPRNDSWTVQLSKMLPPNYRFVRLGIGGITLAEAGRCLLPLALASHPSIVTDWNVVNDIIRGVTLTGYTAELDNFLRQLTTQTSAKIFVANVPDLNTLPLVVRVLGSREDLTKLAADWNKAIADVIARYPNRVYLVDLQSDLATFKQHPEWLSSDGLHPTTAGYTQLALAFNEVIKKHP